MCNMVSFKRNRAMYVAQLQRKHTQCLQLETIISAGKFQCQLAFPAEETVLLAVEAAQTLQENEASRTSKIKWFSSNNECSNKNGQGTT